MVLWMVAALVAMVGASTVVFHVIMAWEGQDHSWITGFYWTLTVMSTLGFGDITFQSDVGRLFSVVVLVGGASFILVLLPFTFIQFAFLPWMEHRQSSRAPRQLPPKTGGHLVLTGLGAVDDALIRRARHAGVGYVVLTEDLPEALRLHDLGYKVMVGQLDDPDTYVAARLGSAALLATLLADTRNTNIAFTAREIAPQVPIVASAASQASVDILQLAGCDEVIELGDMLGRALAQRVFGTDAVSHVIGAFGDLRIAEASTKGTSLVGTTLAEARLRERCNVSVVGVWQRGELELAGPETILGPASVLILAGSDEQLAGYDEAFGTTATPLGQESGVVIIGGGRVGRAAGRNLAEEGVEHRIVEKRSDRVHDTSRYVLGDAAELEVLHRAGIKEAGAALVTTHDDDVNVYLTLYLRRLRPDMQVIARANLDRNVSTLHRAGADFVLSYASTGATAIWNRLGLNDTLMLAEGLDVFRLPMPVVMAGRSLADLGIRRTTGCNVVAVVQDGVVEANPDAQQPLPHDAELVVIGDAAAEQRFLELYGRSRRSTLSPPAM